MTNLGASTVFTNFIEKKKINVASSDATLLRNFVVVKTILDEEEERWINRDREFVFFTKCLDAGHDHAYLDACREIITADFNDCINLKTYAHRVLVLGASSREYREFNNNPNVHFQFANIEAKNLDSTILGCLTCLKTLKKRKLVRNTNTKAIEACWDSLKSIDQMILEFKVTGKIPDRILLWEDTEKMRKEGKSYSFDVLVFLDAGYSFDAQEWGELFRITGASTAIGYMCLPWELLQPDVVSPPGYVYRQKDGYSYLGYHGYSNGYAHKTKAWATLMVNPSLKFADFDLGIEFVSRVGPMTLVRLVRTTKNELVVTRHLEIPDYLKTTFILDVRASFDARRGVIRMHDLRYFGVRTDEFNSAVNYGLDIAKEPVNHYTSILAFILRRCSGVQSSRVPEFALVVYLYVLHLTKEFVKSQEAAFIVDSVRQSTDFFCRGDMFHLLVKDVESSIWQEEALRKFTRTTETLVHTELRPYEGDMDELEDIGNCYFCTELKGVCGDQLFTCQREKEQEFHHTFTLTSTELAHYRTTLADVSKDPIGLKTVKEKALNVVPFGVFENTARVNYICGPPGTGKSHIIRSLATREDLIVGPFSRLKSDYTNFIHPITKKKTTLRFLTHHIAHSAINHGRIFVDEFTAMPYEALCVIVNNCGANEVILVGDHKQTRLIHGIEGLSILEKMELSRVRAHELVKNFRNPSDCVNSLNTLFAYRMLPTNNNRGFITDSISNYDKYPQHTPLFFRHASAKVFGQSCKSGEKVTVRANQGATFDKVKLVVLSDDSSIFQIPGMSIVALSRHRSECVLLCDDSGSANAFKDTIMSSKNNEFNRVPYNISPCFTREQVIQRLGGTTLPLEEEDDDGPARSQSGDDNFPIWREAVCYVSSTSGPRRQPGCLAKFLRKIIRVLIWLLNLIGIDSVRLQDTNATTNDERKKKGTTA